MSGHGGNTEGAAVSAHALTTALRVDMAYLCVGVQTVFSLLLLLAPLFSAIFQGEFMVMVSAIAWVSS